MTERELIHFFIGFVLTIVNAGAKLSTQIKITVVNTKRMARAMQTMMILVIAVLLIGAIIWWFFGKHEQAVETAQARNNRQEATVVVKGGYSPETIVLKKGVPATLNFEMKDSTACLSHVVFDKLGVDRDLTKQKVTSIEIPTDHAGDVNFACGMNMFHGKVVVK